MGLNGAVVYEPALWPMRVTNVPNKPMHRYTQGHSNAHTPDDPRNAANGVENDSDRKLLKHPCSLQEAIKGVISDSRTGIKTRRVLEL